MKKNILTIVLATLLTSILGASKISGNLFYQMKFKELYQEREIDAVPTFLGHCPDLNYQLVYLHFDSKPTDQEIAILERAGVEVFIKSWVPPLRNHPTGFFSAKIPVSMELLRTLEGNEFLKQINSAEIKMDFNLDMAAENNGVSAVSNVPYDLTGEGTKIAVIDSGFELDHVDLPDPLIAVDYSIYSDAVPDSDFTVSNAHTGTGHGTHVAGCIVGQGTLSAGNWTGMAPGADWIGLKIGNDYTGGLSYDGAIHSFKAARFFYDADFINASFGGWSDYHDGSDEACQVVDLVSEDGCAVFISTGNEANKDRHYSGTLSGGATSDFIAINYEDTTIARATYMFNLVWYDDPDTTIQRPMTMVFYNHNYNELSIQSVAEITQSPRGTQSRFGSCTTIGNNPIYIKVTNQSGVELDYHLYSQLSNCKFSDPDPFYTVGSPATADMAISIGSWTTRNEWNNYSFLNVMIYDDLDDIAPSSSRGPRIDGAQKPDFTTPGQMIISLRDDDAYPGPPFGIEGPFVISNNGISGLPANYMAMGGTSMASPIACGAAALLKDFDPLITREEVIIKLWNHASTDEFTGSVPNYTWGAGKLDVEASLHALEEELTPNTPENVQIEYANGDITISWDAVTETIGGRTITPDHYKLYVYDTPYSPVYSSVYDVYDTSIQLSPGVDMYFYSVSCVYEP